MQKSTEVLILTIGMKAMLNRAEFLAEEGKSEEAQALLNKVIVQLARLEQLGEIDVTGNFIPNVTEETEEDAPLFI
jgi:hypothetical protein